METDQQNRHIEMLQRHHPKTGELENSPQAGNHRQDTPADNEVGLILGKKGSGKTTLSRWIAAHTKRAVILDTLGRDYGGGCVVRSPDSLRAYWDRVKGFADFCVIVRPPDDRTADAFFRLVRESTDLVAFVEEADRYCSSWKMQPDLEWSLNYGRQFGQSVIGCARRPAAIHPTWRANADFIIAHNTQEPNDLAWLNEFGFNPEVVRDLAPFRWEMVGQTKLRLPR